MATRRSIRAIREREFPGSRLKGDANLLIMPNLDAANISFNLLRTVSGEGITVGPILLGSARAGAHPHADGDGAPDRQHERVRRGPGRHGARAHHRDAGAAD